MEQIIRIKDLSKSFGDIKAVDNLSFSVKKGELFAFLGENGAGKSTTINIMCNALKKDSGDVLIAGESVDKNFENISRKIGIVFQNSVLDNALTVKDNLKSRAAIYGIFGDEFKNRLEKLSAMLDFGDFLNRSVAKLSGGQKRRIDIARALFHNPEILILDEPTTGLDPQTRKLLWDVIIDLQKSEGLTVFLTTHYMEEAANADYIVVLDGGKIAAEGTPLELKNKYTGDFITLYGVEESEVESLKKPYKAINGGFLLEVQGTIEATKMIIENPQLFVDYEITKGKMDDVFLNITGKKLEGSEQK